MSDGNERAFARKGQLVGIVIAVTMLAWIGLQWLGPALGMPGRFAFLIDLAALAALFWAMVLTYQMWRARAVGRDN